MPLYEFECKKCNQRYETLCEIDDTGKYPGVKCPKCKSKKKSKLMSLCGYKFSNPVGTDKWNNEQTGHDYRFKHNAPNVKKEREMATALSHMGGNPYGADGSGDLGLGEGVHDVEVRPGLS